MMNYLSVLAPAFISGSMFQIVIADIIEGQFLRSIFGISIAAFVMLVSVLSLKGIS